MSAPETFDREVAWHTLRVLEGLFELAGVEAAAQHGSLEAFIDADLLNGVACLVQKCRMVAEGEIMAGVRNVPGADAEADR
jgi:hypothetical protein